ncbi:glutaredoxin family protein [Roseovarius sp. MMSF_3281]|uniref:glutaredoxin family protein n=1 Tax=Roseovarius sp. MMSF_3281 TaxID=3046694 RepID=UPI00273F4B6A|nr:glutaredoxin family protein [Roseovarius sp. MMSF_3281]
MPAARQTGLLPLAAGLFSLATPAGAGTDFTDLTPTERAVFHAEIREALLGLPDLTDKIAPPPIDPYADAIEDDLARIEAKAARLFAPGLPGFGPKDARQTIALMVRPDCPECARAKAELRKLAETHDLRVTLIDITENPDLAQALDLDLAPSYVLPDMMLRGHMPAIVLQRYLAE